MKEKLDAQGYPVATQKVSPQALADFYRKRAESLRENHQIEVTKTMDASQKKADIAPAAQVQRSWFQSLMAAFGAEGY